MSTITDQLGRVLAGRYRLDGALGTGASAHVYRATDLRLGRVVALKLLHPGLGGDEAFLRRFRAEAQAVAALSHANLVRLYDWGWEEGEPFLVLEYLPGGSLRDLLDDGLLLSPAQAAEVGAAAARGLAHAHRRGLVHRDVKPANLLFDEEGVVRVADFGLARALADAAWTEPAGAVLGTARYASSEQAEGKALDGRSDVYSLALVLYEAVTGDVPFRGDSTLGTLRARVGARLPPAAGLGPLYPLLAQATISDPLARLDAAELAVEFDTLLIGLGRPPRLPVREATTTSALPRPARLHAPATGTLTGVGPRPVLYDLDDRTEHGFAPAAGRGGAEPALRHRHWGRRALALVVALALLAGGAFFVRRDVLYNHVVPALAGLPLPAATTRATSAGLRLHVTGKAYSPTVAAGEVLSLRPGAGARLGKGAVVDVALSAGPRPVAVPLVESKPAATAEQAVTAAHFVPVVAHAYSETVTKGIVIVQSPAKGSRVPGHSVRLVVSLGPSPRTIPQLGGDTWAAAKQALTALRLVPVMSRDYSSTVARNEVISTTPAEGSGGVPVGATVQVLVSKGPQLVTVPPVVGDSISDAVATLQAAGLNVNEVVGPPFATQATTTDPAPGSQVNPGSAITLYAA
ncbi:MAG TPA: PASTA domain-containing protein [Acidimicrobiales bacterium]|nr:PASTA domain-containing protein [Acidimicrobiales bacterium]